LKPEISSSCSSRIPSLDIISTASVCTRSTTLVVDGVARILVEEGRGRNFVVLYRLLGSRCPFSMYEEENRMKGLFNFIVNFYLPFINIFY